MLQREIYEEIGFTFPENTKFCKVEGGALTVEKSQGVYSVTYQKDSQLARAALLAKAYGDEDFKIVDKRILNDLCFMIDCSRNAVLKVETVKKLIRNLSMLGYNCMMLYTEDTYEVEGEPVFGYLRGRFTQAEMKEIDAYALSYGIEMIPCMQTLAHLQALKRWYHAFEDLFDIDDILMAGDERVYALIDKMFATLSKCFSSRRIHIGMDEAHNVGRGQYMDKNGYENSFEVLSNHLTRVAEIAAKYGYSVMMWSDMFWKLAMRENRRFDKKGNVLIPQDILDKVPQNATLCHWDYGARHSAAYEHRYRMHQDFNNPVWMSVSSYKVGGFTPSNELSAHEMDLAFKMCKKYGINSLINCGWGDGGAEASVFSILPSIVNVSGKAHERSKAQMKKEFLALTGYTYQNFVKIEWLDSGCGKYTYDNVKVSKVMMYNDLFLGQLDTEVKTEYVKDIKRAANALARMQKGQYHYIFKSMQALARVMEIKYTLGVRIREAYSAKDTQALQKCTEDIDVLIKRIQAFIPLFKAQWMQENKPHGFDIQEYRLGGVLLRLKGCKERIKEFIDGKVENIPELDETLIYDVWQGRNAVTGRMGYNSYELISSVNKF